MLSLAMQKNAIDMKEEDYCVTAGFSRLALPLRF
jgi:hypothetical protein